MSKGLCDECADREIAQAVACNAKEKAAGDGYKCECPRVVCPHPPIPERFRKLTDA